MARNTQAKHDALRSTLVEIAERRMAQGGLEVLKARDLAQEAGCSVGAIYNVFGDLKSVAVAVNGRTFHRIGETVGARVTEAQLPPRDTLVALSLAYLDFATDNPRLWRALFEIEFTADDDVPAWYRHELGKLFGFIAAPLGRLYPDYSSEDITLLTRALFSSVHGIVWLGLERRISGVPRAQLARMIELTMRNLSSG